MSSSHQILYVDDNNDSRELVRTLLFYADPDYVVTLAETADKVLGLIERQPFDLYIFDYNMPGMSGIELCRYIRQYDTETPILFFSAMARPVDYAEGVKAGATEYLVKPNDLGKLTEIVKKFLGREIQFTSDRSYPEISRADFPPTILNSRLTPLELLSDQESPALSRK